MRKVYLYLLNTMADWETGYISAELHSRRFFKKDAEEIIFKHAAVSKESIKTMGGLSVVPDCTIDEISADENTVLILPGADSWNEVKSESIREKALIIPEGGGTVCAICGATAALAKKGVLDKRPHTSNGKGFLEMFVPEYKGSEFFVDEAAVCYNNLITASATGSLLWTKLILQKLNVFKNAALDEWYNYFNTGKAEHFFALMQMVSR